MAAFHGNPFGRTPPPPHFSPIIRSFLYSTPPPPSYPTQRRTALSWIVPPLSIRSSPKMETEFFPPLLPTVVLLPPCFRLGCHFLLFVVPSFPWQVPLGRLVGFVCPLPSDGGFVLHPFWVRFCFYVFFFSIVSGLEALLRRVCFLA